MNIYDLEKQATPGPWLQRYGNDLHAGTLERSQRIGWMVPTNGTMDELQRAFSNVQLAAHCRNNYMRLLQDYKNLVANAKACGCLCLHGGTDHGKEIAELEEVKP